MNAPVSVSPPRSNPLRGVRGFALGAATLLVAAALLAMVGIHEYTAVNTGVAVTAAQAGQSSAARLEELLSRVTLLARVIDARTVGDRGVMKTSESLIEVGRLLPEAHAVLLLDRAGSELGSSELLVHNDGSFAHAKWFNATENAAPAAINIASTSQPGSTDSQIVLSTRLPGRTSSADRIVAFVFAGSTFTRLLIPNWAPARITLTVRERAGDIVFATHHSGTKAPSPERRLWHRLAGIFVPSAATTTVPLPGEGLQIQVTIPSSLAEPGGLAGIVSFLMIVATGVLALVAISTTGGTFIRSDAREREIEAERRRLGSEIERVREDRDRVLASVGHDVRTPLTTIVGANTILEESDLPDNYRQWVVKIGASARTLLAMLNGLLDMARGDAREASLTIDEVDVVGLISDVCSMLEGQARQKHLRLVTRIEDDVFGFWRTDATRVRVILVNLIGNALKYTSVGEVEVAASVKRDADQRDHLRLRVRDTGQGIPESDRAAIFERFNRGSRPRTPSEPGLGLGLAICRDNAKLMGALLEVESELGVGSEFTFEFPTERIEKKMRPAPFRGAAVIIVGFSESYRRRLVRHLESVGCVVETAPDGYVGIGVIERTLASLGSADVAVIDGHMRGMPCEVFVKRVRSAPALSRVRLVAIAERESEQDSALSVDALVAPPGELNDLCDAIERVTQGWSPLHVLNPNVESAPQTRILVVEDDPAIQAVIKTILEKRDFTVFVASTGEEAVRMAGTVDVQAILMDIELGGIDGYEATRRIRSSGGVASRIPVIALTALSGALVSRRARDAGISFIIEKPVDPQRLAHNVRALVTKSRQIDEHEASKTSAETGEPGSTVRVTDAARLGVSGEFLEAMVEEVGEARAQVTLDAFIDDARTRTARLVEVVAAEESDAAARACREIAETGEQFGAIALCEAVEELGAALERGDYDLARTLSLQAEDAAVKLGPALRERLSAIIANRRKKRAA